MVTIINYLLYGSKTDPVNGANYKCLVEIDDVRGTIYIPWEEAENAGVWSAPKAQAYLEANEEAFFDNFIQSPPRWGAQYLTMLSDLDTVINYTRPPVSNLTEALDVLDAVILGIQKIARSQKKELLAHKKLLE